MSNSNTATVNQPKPRRNNEQRDAHNAIVRYGTFALIFLGAAPEMIREVLKLGYGLISDRDEQDKYFLLPGFEIETHQGHFEIVSLSSKKDADTKSRAAALLDFYQRVYEYRNEEDSAAKWKFTITPCAPLPTAPALSEDGKEIVYDFAVQGGVPHVVGYNPDGKAFFFDKASCKVMRAFMDVNSRIMTKAEIFPIYFMTEGSWVKSAVSGKEELVLQFPCERHVYSAKKAEEKGDPNLTGKPIVDTYWDEDGLIQEGTDGSRPAINAGYLEMRLTEMADAIPQDSKEVAQQHLGQTIGSMLNLG